jgi:hypothetical protein
LTERSEVPAETPDLVGSWIAYERMVAAGIGPASIEELMGEAGIAAPAVVELPVVDVQTLLYRGPAALVRAQELREIAKRTPPGALPALFEEVCDLVVLAFEPGA